MLKQIETAVIPRLKLKVGDREFSVVFPLSAVIQAEEALGKPLKSLGDWFDLQAKDVSAVLKAGLAKDHAPEDIGPIAEEICSQLNPESLDEVLYALCMLAFPRRMAAYEESLKKEKTSPNV